MKKKYSFKSKAKILKNVGIKKGIGDYFGGGGRKFFRRDPIIIQAIRATVLFFCPNPRSPGKVAQA